MSQGAPLRNVRAGASYPTLRRGTSHPPKQNGQRDFTACSAQYIHALRAIEWKKSNPLKQQTIFMQPAKFCFSCFNILRRSLDCPHIRQGRRI
jgi:hypothetical protein